MEKQFSFSHYLCVEGHMDSWQKLDSLLS